MNSESDNDLGSLCAGAIVPTLHARVWRHQQWPLFACLYTGLHRRLLAMQAYFMLDEMLLAGQLQEPSKKVSLGLWSTCCDFLIADHDSQSCLVGLSILQFATTGVYMISQQHSSKEFRFTKQFLLHINLTVR